MTNNSKIYLDYAATTPASPPVVNAMMPFFVNQYGNPASLHWAGREAKAAVADSRTVLAEAIGAKPEEITFTSSATEANNLAIKGLALAQGENSKRNKILVSAVEHDCVLNSAFWLEKYGFEVNTIPVDEFGQVRLKWLRKKMDDDVLLVSVMHASNEIGTVQPIDEVGQLCRQFKAKFHVDAAQTFGKLPINVSEMGIDLLTTSSHKIYGPKGVGFLYVDNRVELEPLLHGGGQEQGLRSSTLNVPAIVGFKKAIEIALDQQREDAKCISSLRDKLIAGVLNQIPQSHLNGHPENRLYNNAHFRFDFVEGESIVLGLDEQGVAASTGSACSSPNLEPSHVLLATGLTKAQAHGSLRLTLGRFTTEEEINHTLLVLPKVIEKLRKLSPFKT